MEKLEFVKDGVLRLPPGFRFHPTDEELVVQYLGRKASCCPLPAAVIPEIDLAKHDPWDLPGDSDGERYFFNSRVVKYRNGTFRSIRATFSGDWKVTGKDTRIMASGNQLVGMKKTLVFHQGKHPGFRTNWVMHEYRLAGTGTTAHNENWVVCRIFKKNRTTKMEGEGRRRRSFREVRGNDVGFIDFMRQQSSSACSSSRGSSCVTELSDESSNGDEADSRSIVSSPHG